MKGKKIVKKIKAETSTPLLLTPRQAARLLGVGLQAMRTLLRSGELRVVNIGARQKIISASLVEWVAKQERAFKPSKFPVRSPGERVEVAAEPSDAPTVPQTPAMES